MCGYRSICSVTSDTWSVLSDRITATTGQSFLIRQHVSVSGGCISQVWKVSDGQRDYFVKVNDSVGLTLFEAEAAGLAELAASQAVRVPEPVCWGSIGRRTYLVLEYLPLVSGSRRAMASRSPISVGIATTGSARPLSPTVSMTTGLHFGRSSDWVFS